MLAAEIIYKSLVLHPAWPWVIGILAAVAFGLVGLRTRGSWVLWGLGGGVIAFMIAEIVAGLADATSLPYTETVKSARQTVAMIIAVIIIGVVGFLLAVSAGGGLLWKKPKPSTTPTLAATKP